MKNTVNNLAIIIGAETKREADARITLLTENGIKTVHASGLRRANAKLASALQIFNIVEVAISGHKIIGAHIVLSAGNITREIHRFYLGCSIIEMIQKTTDKHYMTSKGDAEIFYLVARTIEALNNSEISAYKIFLNFFAKFLVLQGYDIDDFEHSSILEKFKRTDNEKINEIQLDLVTAKKCVSYLNQCYIENLGLEIPCLEHFI